MFETRRTSGSTTIFMDGNEIARVWHDGSVWRFSNLKYRTRQAAEKAARVSHGIPNE